MKRLFLLTLVILSALAIPDITTNAQTQFNAFCRDYIYGDFLQEWNFEIGQSLPALDQVRAQVRQSDYLHAVRIWQYPDSDILSAVWMDIRQEDHANYPIASTPANPQPYMIQVKIFKDGVKVFDTTYSVNPGTDPSGTADARITIPNVEADNIEITITQMPRTGGVLDRAFTVNVTRVCGASNFPTPTPTPTNTLPPPTATTGPSATPFPSSTPRPTNTPTKTRTPVPTWTPFPNTLPPSWTPAPTSTPGGATDTPVPSYTPTVSPTAVIPTQEPMQSTLAEPQYSTPIPPNDECTDPSDPCEYFPPMIFPEIGLESPTPIALLPTLTALPSITPAIAATNGTPGYEPVEVRRLSTAINEVDTVQKTLQAGPSLIDAEGTPIYIAQKVYETGATIGGFWSVVRSITDSDLGPIGGFLIFLIAMIILNIQARLILFLAPIIIKLVQFVLSIIGTVLKILLFMGCIAIALLASPEPAKAQDPTNTPIPISTFTPTPTLYAIPPTATSKYQGFRQTPTPIPYVQQFDPDIFGLNTDEGTGQLADTIINSYRFMNSNSGIMDMFAFLLLVGVCVVLLINIHRRLTKDTG